MFDGRYLGPICCREQNHVKPMDKLYRIYYHEHMCMAYSAVFDTFSHEKRLHSSSHSFMIRCYTCGYFYFQLPSISIPHVKRARLKHIAWVDCGCGFKPVCFPYQINRFKTIRISRLRTVTFILILCILKDLFLLEPSLWSWQIYRFCEVKYFDWITLIYSL